jgi:hypothetical protein
MIKSCHLFDHSRSIWKYCHDALIAHTSACSEKSFNQVTIDSLLHPIASHHISALHIHNRLPCQFQCIIDQFICFLHIIVFPSTIKDQNISVSSFSFHAILLPRNLFCATGSQIVPFADKYFHDIGAQSSSFVTSSCVILKINGLPAYCFSSISAIQEYHLLVYI